MPEPSPCLLHRLLDTPSPSGHEEPVMAALEEHLSPLLNVCRDRLGSMRVLLAGENPDVKVLLFAHADEIGLSVRYIDSDGFIWFAPIGGVDRRTLPGAQVTVHGRKGTLGGVVGVKPVHFCDQEERRKGPTLTDMYIDIGASSREEAEEAVEVGDAVTVISRPTELLGKRVAGRGLDDRAGCYVLAEALRILAESDEKPPVNVLAVFTSQEEVGLRGATVAARSAGACIGICIETELCTDQPGIDRHLHGEVRLDAGPILPRGAAVSPRVLDYLRKTAEREEIRVQVIDLSQPEGTEASVMQISGEGMATALVMIPLRYMHSPAEVASLSDLDNAVRLLVASIRGIGGASELKEVLKGPVICG